MNPPIQIHANYGKFGEHGLQLTKIDLKKEPKEFKMVKNCNYIYKYIYIFFYIFKKKTQN